MASSVRCKSDASKYERIDTLRLQVGTVQLANFKLQLSILIETEYISAEALFLCLWLVMIPNIGDAFEIVEVEGVVHLQLLLR